MRQMISCVAVAEREVVVLDRGGALRLEILPERAPRREIDELQAATYAEHRLVIAHRPFGEHELDAVARGIGPVTIRVTVLAVDGWIDVRPAWKKDTVELVVNTAQRVGIVRQERDHPRDGTSGRERLNVALAHGPRRRKVSWNSAEALKGLSRDPDYWAF
jgi:hypothetical protein